MFVIQIVSVFPSKKGWYANLKKVEGLPTIAGRQWQAHSKARAKIMTLYMILQQLSVASAVSNQPAPPLLLRALASLAWGYWYSTK